jgi:4-hydroxy-tetrahydrodipicolinate synthase
MLNFKGLLTALVTPFTDNDKIDYDALEILLRGQVEAKIPGVVMLGSTGESFAISDAEYQEIIKFVVQNFSGKLKILVGAGTNNTHSSINKSRLAENLGADGVLIVNPYYNKPPQEGLYKHFAAIAENIDIPIILYNIPGRTGVNLQTPTLLDLIKQHKNIIGIKESSSDLDQVMEVISHTKDNFMTLSGDDSLTYPIISLGGNGAISVISNILPELTNRMVNLTLDHQFNPGRLLHYKMLKLMNALISFGNNPIAIKTLLAYQNKIKENFRLPLCSLDSNKKEQLIKVFEDCYSG